MLANELPVYKDSYSLVGVAIDLTRSYPKAYKYTIGQRIIDVSLSLFECIHLANIYKADRVRHLNEFLVRFELLKTLMRLSYDKKLISTKQFAGISQRCDKIGRQVSAWKNVSRG